VLGTEKVEKGSEYSRGMRDTGNVQLGEKSVAFGVCNYVDVHQNKPTTVLKARDERPSVVFEVAAISARFLDPFLQKDPSSIESL
jgi:hypothetical protein